MVKHWIKLLKVQQFQAESIKPEEDIEMAIELDNIHSVPSGYLMIEKEYVS